MSTPKLLRYLVIAGISLASLSVVGALYNMLCVYVIAAGYLLYLQKEERYAVALVCGLPITALSLRAMTRYLPQTYDAALWQLDGILAFDPSVFMICAFPRSSLLWKLSEQVYYALPLAMAAAIAFRQSETKRFGLKLATAAVMGFLLYFIIPARGPAYFLMGITEAPRNAMPSLHLTWALLIWYHLRGAKLPARLMADVFLLFTIIATLATGEHYLVDLVVAVPFWLMIERYAPDWQTESATGQAVENRKQDRQGTKKQSPATARTLSPPPGLQVLGKTNTE